METVKKISRALLTIPARIKRKEMCIRDRSGVMDTRAAALADILVGNDENEAVLEVTMMGPVSYTHLPEAVCLIFATIFHTFATGMKEYLKLTEYGPGRYNDCRK